VEAGFTAWELTSFVITVGISDLYINYVHVRAFVGCCKRRGRLISEDSVDNVNNLAAVYAQPEEEGKAKESSKQVRKK